MTLSEKNIHEDPLRLAEKPPATSVQLARRAPDPRVEQLCGRILSSQYGDSLDVRVQLLAHALFIAYADLKRVIADE
jgi:hypothetical protein